MAFKKPSRLHVGSRRRVHSHAWLRKPTWRVAKIQKVAADVYRGWRSARVVENRRVAVGSMWLTLQAIDDWAAAYEPGHVLSLGLSLENGFLRHAYTVSRDEFGSGQFEHLYRQIPHGQMTPHLSEMLPGTNVFFQERVGIET